MSYNGWSNRETWVIALWNDIGRDAEEWVEPLIEDFPALMELDDPSNDLSVEFGHYLESAFEEWLIDSGYHDFLERTSGMLGDLLPSDPLSEVNWVEIAHTHLSDLDWDSIRIRALSEVMPTDEDSAVDLCDSLLFGKWYVKGIDMPDQLENESEDGIKSLISRFTSEWSASFESVSELASEFENFLESL